MKLEDKYLLKWFLKCRKIADDSLIFLAILTGGGARGGQDLFQGGAVDPLGYATDFDDLIIIIIIIIYIIIIGNILLSRKPLHCMKIDEITGAAYNF